MEFYQYCLEPFVENYELTPEGINTFLSDLKCGNAKHAYYRAIRVFCNWATREDYIEDNPIKRVNPPNISDSILPSLTSEQVNHLISVAGNQRAKCIIGLFADSGMRLSELTYIKSKNVDWDKLTIVIWGQGNRQGRAPFTQRSARLLRQVISQYGDAPNIWNMEPHGIQQMLQKLKVETGLPCNHHTSRRTFASNLHRAGVDIEYIMRLGGWSSLDMVLTYTKSVRFEDSLKHYHAAMQ
ncbi:MAG: tyrosine-type recombinase/integrase [Candidatus Thorarchaeota archaeon]|jgi:integrase/recombinase XerC